VHELPEVRNAYNHSTATLLIPPQSDLPELYCNIGFYIAVFDVGVLYKNDLVVEQCTLEIGGIMRP
jgi:hypothetical protein